jgi:hypothetical protein
MGYDPISMATELPVGFTPVEGTVNNDMSVDQLNSMVNDERPVATEIPEGFAQPEKDKEFWFQSIMDKHVAKGNPYGEDASLLTSYSEAAFEMFTGGMTLEEAENLRERYFERAQAAPGNLYRGVKYIGKRMGEQIAEDFRKANDFVQNPLGAVEKYIKDSFTLPDPEQYKIEQAQKKEEAGKRLKEMGKEVGPMAVDAIDFVFGPIIKMSRGIQGIILPEEGKTRGETVVKDMLEDPGPNPLALRIFNKIDQPGDEPGQTASKIVFSAVTGAAIDLASFNPKGVFRGLKNAPANYRANKNIQLLSEIEKDLPVLRKAIAKYNDEVLQWPNKLMPHQIEKINAVDIYQMGQVNPVWGNYLKMKAQPLTPLGRLRSNRGSIEFAPEGERLKSSLKAITASTKMPMIVSGQQALKTLLNAGLKKEELVYSGIEDYLKTKDKFTKEELLNYIDANKVKVEVKTLGGKGVMDHKDFEAAAYAHPLNQDIADEGYSLIVHPEEPIIEIMEEGGDILDEALLPPNVHEYLQKIREDVSTGRATAQARTGQLTEQDILDNAIDGHPAISILGEKGYVAQLNPDRTLTFYTDHISPDTQIVRPEELDSDVQEAMLFAEQQLETILADSREVMGEMAEDIVADAAAVVPPTKFKEYTLPGGENYQEHLITLPAKELPKAQQLTGRQALGEPKILKMNQENTGEIDDTTGVFVGDYGEGYDKILMYPSGGYIFQMKDGTYLVEVENTSYADADLAKVEDWFVDFWGAELELKTGVEKFAQPVFKGGHFDEPNVVAHVRTTDRTSIDGKKVLFVEEIQSDWHLAGKKKGYIQPTEPVPYELEYETMVEKFLQRLDQNNDNLGYDTTRGAVEGLMEEYTRTGNAEEVVNNWEWTTPEDRALAVEYITRRAGGEGQAAIGMRSGQVPDAPFKNSWHELAVKQMIDKAVKEGYDEIAFISGTQTADRYNLAKYVDELEVKPALGMDKGYNVYGNKGGSTAVSKLDVAEKDLADVIGAELAEKAIADLAIPEVGYQRSSVAYRGDDLKLGGEWAFKFYDKILPKAVGKYVGQWGSKIKDVKMQFGVPESAITAEGQVLKNITWGKALDELEKGKKIVVEDKQGEQIIIEDKEAFDALDKEFVESFYAIGDAYVQKGFEITPTMRQEVSTVGQPMFGNRLPGSFSDKMKSKKGFAGQKEMDPLPDDLSKKPGIVEDLQVAKDLEKTLGVTKDPKKIGFLTPEGKGIDLSLGKGKINTSHRKAADMIASSVEEITKQGIMRIIPVGTKGVKEFGLSMTSIQPTKAQMDMIKKISQGKPIIVDIFGYEPREMIWSEEFRNYANFENFTKRFEWKKSDLPPPEDLTSTRSFKQEPPFIKFEKYANDNFGDKDIKPPVTGRHHTLTMERVAEFLDGGIQGPTYKAIVEPVYKAAEQMQLEGAATKEAVDKFKIIEGTKQDRDASLFAQGKLKDTTPEGRQAAEYVRAKYDEYIDRLNEVRAKVGVEPIKKRKDYITHLHEQNVLSEIFGGLGQPSLKRMIQIRKSEILDKHPDWSDARALAAAKRMVEGAKGLEVYIDAKQPIFKFAKQRLKEHEENPSLIRSFNAYMQQALRYVYQAENVARNKAYKDVLPPNAKSFTMKWNTEQVAGRTPPTGLEPNLKRAIMALRGTFGANTILGNAATTMMQLTSFPQVVAFAGLRNTLVGILKRIASYSPYRTSLFETSRTKHLRNLNIDIGLGDSLLDSLLKTIGKWESARDPAAKTRYAIDFGRKFLMGVMETADQFTVGASYEAFYMKGIQEGMSPEIALEYAEIMTGKTQANYFKEALPPFLNTTEGKILGQFGTYGMNQYQMLTRDAGKKFLPEGASTKDPASVMEWTIKFLVAAYVVDTISEKTFGRQPYDVKDLADVSIKAAKGEAGAGQVVEQLKDTTLSYVPYLSSMKYKSLPMTAEFGKDVLNATIGDGREQKKAQDDMVGRWSYSLLFPYAGNQIRKGVEGIQAIKDDDPKFTINSNIDKMKAVLFGPYATEASQQYYTIRDERNFIKGKYRIEGNILGDENIERLIQMTDKEFEIYTRDYVEKTKKQIRRKMRRRR